MRSLGSEIHQLKSQRGLIFNGFMPKFDYLFYIHSCVTEIAVTNLMRQTYQLEIARLEYASTLSQKKHQSRKPSSTFYHLKTLAD